MVKTYFGCGQQGKDTSSDQLLHSPGCRYTDHHSHALVLPIKGTWFRMILSGEKLEEYREIKPYWEKRFARYFLDNIMIFPAILHSLRLFETPRRKILYFGMDMEMISQNSRQNAPYGKDMEIRTGVQNMENSIIS